MYENIVPIVRETREMLLPLYGKAEVVAQKDAQATNVVTKLDTEIEEFLKRRFHSSYPDITFVGEETGGDRTANRFWLVDPIDGTGLYVHGLPFCTTQLALIEERQVTFSVIYDFVNDIMYHAKRGGGAFMNGEPIRVSTRPLSQSYVGWESHIDKKENYEKFLCLREHCILFKAVASGYEYAMVASGKLEGRICFDPWGVDYDFAPGSLLVKEAGGIVQNLGSRSYDYKNLDFIAGNEAFVSFVTTGENAFFPIVR